jgi:hypothetical protein
VLEDTDDVDDGINNIASSVLTRFPRWFILGHVEGQQCDLGCTLLAAAKGWYPDCIIICLVKSRQSLINYCCIHTIFVCT